MPILMLHISTAYDMYMLHILDPLTCVLLIEFTVIQGDTKCKHTVLYRAKYGFQLKLPIQQANARLTILMT